MPQRHAPRHLPMSLLLFSAAALCLAGAMAQAGTREVSLHGPNGDGGNSTADCSDAPTPVVTVPETRPAAARAARPVTVKIKPIVTVHGGGSDEGSTHAARWHSFLPGMFR
jgi:hypothetical protein